MRLAFFNKHLVNSMLRSLTLSLSLSLSSLSTSTTASHRHCIEFIKGANATSGPSPLRAARIEPCKDPCEGPLRSMIRLIGVAGCTYELARPRATPLPAAALITPSPRAPDRTKSPEGGKGSAAGPFRFPNPRGWDFTLDGRSISLVGPLNHSLSRPTSAGAARTRATYRTMGALGGASGRGRAGARGLATLPRSLSDPARSAYRATPPSGTTSRLG
jgi:hypothetical protein